MFDIDKVIKWSTICFFISTADTNGLPIGTFTLTPSTIFLLTSVGLICYRRFTSGQPIVSPLVLSQPAVLAVLVYFTCGAMSGVFASDTKVFFSALVQRMIILLFPTFACIYFAKSPKDFTPMLLGFLPIASFIAVAAFIDSARLRFSAPSYVFNLHKNQIGADCSSIILICAAFYLTRQRKDMKWLFIVATGCALLGFVGCQARAAMIGTIAGIALMMILLRIRMRWLTLAGFAAAIGGGIVWSLLPHKLTENLTATDRFSSAWIRQVSWQYLWEVVSRNPLICVGWGNAIPTIEETNLADGASIFFLDWIQMGFWGLLAQLAMVGSAILTPVFNSFKIPRFSITSTINLALMGILLARFFNGYLDSFWVGRGAPLTTFAALGGVVFISLWAKRLRSLKTAKRKSRAKPQPKLNSVAAAGINP